MYALRRYAGISGYVSIAHLFTCIRPFAIRGILANVPSGYPKSVKIHK